jgi:protein-tyrosine-phosphatase
MVTDPEELERRLQPEIARLSDEFHGAFSSATIEKCVRDSLTRLSSAPSTPARAAFAYRFAQERLRALAGVEGRIPRTQPRVLFVCVSNAGRSQMAAALMHQLSRGRVEAHQAGLRPAPQISATMVTVMAEARIDVTDQFPKPLTDEMVRAADIVITLGCDGASPLTNAQDWPIEDPRGQPIEQVRVIRDQVHSRVQHLLSDMNVPDAG